MTALVAAIEARVAELRQVIADATPGPWVLRHGFPAYISAPSGGVSINAISDDMAWPDATAIVTAVNLLPALLDHIERVVQRHAESPAEPGRCSWCFDNVDMVLDPWPCPDLISAATAVGIDPALHREDPT